MPTKSPAAAKPRDTEHVTVIEGLAGTRAVVDSTAGIIRGVKLIGFESKNGRFYRPETLRQAVHLYEGVRVNVDHPHGNDPSGPRNLGDRIGAIRSARFLEGQGIFGDFHFNPKHKLAEQVAWDAEHNPEALGFSHNALLKMGGGVKNGRRVVEQIARVRSVDLVADPATTRSLFESEGASDDEDPNAPEDLSGQPTGRSRELKDLPDSVFAHIASGGKRDASGRTTPRSKRLWPLHNSDSVRAAIASIQNSKSLNDDERGKALSRARTAARRLKIPVKEHDTMSDLATMTLEDLRASRPDLVELLESEQASMGEAEQLKTKLAETQKVLEQLQSKEKLQEREAAITEELKAAGLDRGNKQQVSDVFWSQLIATEAVDGRKPLIEDRASLVKAVPGKSAGGLPTKPISTGATNALESESLTAEQFASRLRRR